MKSEIFQRSFLLLLVTVVSIVFLWMIRSFLMTLLLGAIFSSLMRPLYLRILVSVKGKQKTAAGLTLTVFILLIIIPLCGFLGLVTNQAIKVTEVATPWVQEKIKNKAAINQSLHALPGYSYVEPYSDQILQKASEAASGLGNFIFKQASTLTAITLIFFVNLTIMLYAMFFFFMDGPAVLKKIFYYMPLENKDEKKLIDGFRSMARATVKGIVIIGAAQGFLGGLALWAAGIPSSLFWGTAMAVLSIVPNVGAALIWAPACAYLFITGATAKGVMVLLWCTLVVGTIDNFLRPILVGKDTEVHELLILISTLGGLGMLGLPGFILGPVIALLFLTIWDIYGTTFKDILPKAGDF